jgi:hypothetical protein
VGSERNLGSAGFDQVGGSCLFVYWWTLLFIFQWTLISYNNVIVPWFRDGILNEYGIILIILFLIFLSHIRPSTQENLTEELLWGILLLSEYFRHL